MRLPNAPRLHELPAARRTRRGDDFWGEPRGQPDARAASRRRRARAAAPPKAPTKHRWQSAARSKYVAKARLLEAVIAYQTRILGQATLEQYQEAYQRKDEANALVKPGVPLRRDPTTPR